MSSPHESLNHGQAHITLADLDPTDDVTPGSSSSLLPVALCLALVALGVVTYIVGRIWWEKRLAAKERRYWERRRQKYLEEQMKKEAPETKTQEHRS